jgi:hypothetical protein
MLNIPMHLLPKLYDGNPKIITLIAEGAPPTTIFPIDNYVFRKAADKNEFILVGDDRQPKTDFRSLRLPPSNIWALWVPHHIEDGTVAELQAWWGNQAGKDIEFPFVKEGRSAVLELLLQRALQDSQKLRLSNVVLMRDLATMRESWIDHAKIPSEVDELLSNLRLDRPRLTFSNADIPENPSQSVTFTAQSRLIQRLPTGARGFLGFDISILRAGYGNGTLCAEIVARDTGTVLGKGHRSLDALTAGWLPFRLPSACAASSHSLEVHLWIDDATSDGILEIATAPVGLFPEFGVQCKSRDGASADASGRMIALKLWGSLPGVHMSRPGASTDGSVNTVETPLPNSLIEAVRLTREMSAPYPLFGYISRGKILLRPFRAVPSSAVVHLPATCGLIGVSCEAMIDDRRCETRGLAARVVLTPAGTGPDDAEKGIGALAATDWIDLNQPLAASLLTLQLVQPFNNPAELHLFTRLPEPGPVPPHGRIVFGSFVAHVHASSAWNATPVVMDVA